ncbi:MAG: branched-chain amino acid ABC transporter permease [Alphaproteobacteria bacterium]|nr:branched-chain amino acid ABC transporter permease [Alphaproteobacteria bacterium]
MSTFLFHFLNGLQLSMLIFLLAVGLTLIFGLMDSLNLAHGGFYTIGAYGGWIVASQTGSFWLALVIAPLFAAALGVLLEVLVQRPLINRGRSSHLDVALLTFGLLFVIMGLMEVVFGAAYLSIKVPPLLSDRVEIFERTYPVYRLFIIGLGLVIALLLWLLLDKTVFGAIVRAGVDNREMVLGMGINITLVFAIVFGLGCALAALAGVIAAPILSIFSRMGATILVVTFIVVVVGGLGNFKGSFYGSILVGMIDTFALAYLPEAGLFAIYVVLAVFMMVRPQGIFGVKGQSA